MARSPLAELVSASSTAVVVQELQSGVVGAASAFPELAAAAAQIGVVANAAIVLAAARRAGVPVVHATAENLPGGFGVNRNARLFAAARTAGAANAPGTPSVAPVDGLLHVDDLVLPRYHGLSPMTGGPLDSLLRNAGITTLVVMGVSLNIAILNLVFDAVNRAYEVVVVTDAVAAVPVAYGVEVLCNTLRPLATFAAATEVAAAWSAA